MTWVVCVILRTVDCGCCGNLTVQLMLNMSWTMWSVQLSKCD